MCALAKLNDLRVIQDSIALKHYDFLEDLIDKTSPLIQEIYQAIVLNIAIFVL